MSRDELINEIVRRVMAKIAEYEKNSNCSSGSNTVSVNNNCTNNNNNTSTVSAPIGKETHVDKRLLSERDVIDACISGINIVYYSKKTIVTDLAKDYARAHKVQLIKE